MRSMLLNTDGGTRLVSRPLHTGKSRGEYLTACQQLHRLYVRSNLICKNLEQLTCVTIELLINNLFWLTFLLAR